MSVLITKMDGVQEPFDHHKLGLSLSRSGASSEIRNKVIEKVKKILYDGITTQEIYQTAFEYLSKENGRNKHPAAAARYSIKRAVLDLGPSGFPFERFIAAIFREIGYSNVKTGIAMQGKCAPHEVDLLADYGDKRIAGEIKFHNSLGIKSDLKVALYIKARFDDLADQIDEGWFITNTRFTRNAIRYGACNNMKMLGWDYPRGRGIEKLVDQAGVHPVTALTSLTKSEKRRFLDDNVVMCRSIKNNPEILRHYGVKKADDALKEAIALCEIAVDTK